MFPSTEIIDKAVKRVKTGFTTEIFTCSKINKLTFDVSVVNVRGGQKHLIDYTFSTKTGNLIRTNIVESKYID